MKKYKNELLNKTPVGSIYLTTNGNCYEKNKKNEYVKKVKKNKNILEGFVLGSMAEITGDPVIIRSVADGKIKAKSNASFRLEITIFSIFDNIEDLQKTLKCLRKVHDKHKKIALIAIDKEKLKK